MTVTFYEGPMDGQKLDGMADGTAHHIGDGVYIVKDEDGNEIARAEFSDGPVPPSPAQMRALRAHFQRLRRIQIILALVSCTLFLAGEIVIDARWGRMILGIAWAVMTAAVMVRR